MAVSNKYKQIEASGACVAHYNGYDYGKDPLIALWESCVHEFSKWQSLNNYGFADFHQKWVGSRDSGVQCAVVQLGTRKRVRGGLGGRQ